MQFSCCRRFARLLSQIFLFLKWFLRRLRLVESEKKLRRKSDDEARGKDVADRKIKFVAIYFYAINYGRASERKIVVCRHKLSQATMMPLKQ